MQRSIALAAAAAFAAPAFGQGAAPAPTRIGAAAAVKGQVRAQAPASVGRVVESGKPLYLNDHVTTDKAGKLQVMLLDETVFTVGPESDMVLDQFVYDPFTDSGKIAATVTKGVFRFVTGKVARRDPSHMKIKLPVGTIGIRGTVATFTADAENTTAIILGPGGHGDSNESRGAITFENNGVQRVIDEPGHGVTCKLGESPSKVMDLSDVANKISAELSVKPEGKSSKGAVGGSASASKESGEETAKGQAPALAALTDSVVAQGSAKLLNQAADDAVQGFGDGTATWEQARQVQAGTGFFFSGHAPIACSGACINSSNPNNPQGALQLYIDFGARTVGGFTAATGPSGSQGSFIHIHNINTIGDRLEQTIGSSGGSNPISFESLSGNATLTLSGANLGSYTSTSGGSGSFSGSVITLQNAGGVAAANAKTDLQFSGLNNTSQSISASGTFLAPR